MNTKILNVAKNDGSTIYVFIKMASCNPFAIELFAFMHRGTISFFAWSILPHRLEVG